MKISQDAQIVTVTFSTEVEIQFTNWCGFAMDAQEGFVIKVMVYSIIFGVGLLQLPLLVDIAANLLPQYDIKRWSNKVVGGILTATCIAVASGGYWVWYTSVLPLWLHPTPLESWAGASHLFFGTWLWLLTMSNYVAASMTVPGTPATMVPTPETASAKTLRAQTSQDNTALSDMELLASMRRPFFCKYCKAQRPAPTFHCHDCNSCGAEVDHHCPFVNICVGRDNYRYFALFLFHGFVGMVYCSIITFPAFYQCWVRTFALGETISDGTHVDAACSAHPEYTLIFLGPLGLGVAIGNLLMCQVILLLGDIRTVDSLRYLRKTWNLWPILARAWSCHGLRQESALRKLMFTADARWWHFVVPGKWTIKPTPEKKLT